MGQQCRTCAHPQLREIRSLKDAEAPLQALSDKFGIPVSSLWRHFGSARCEARWKAQECAQTAAGDAVDSGRSSPVPAVTLRRRAIAPSRPVKPVSILAGDRGTYAAALSTPVKPYDATPALHPSKSPFPVNAKEVALLASFGYNDQQIADLVGCGASVVTEIIEGRREDGRAVFDVSRQDWAKHFIRLAMEELIGLRRRRQAALDGLRWREAERYDPKIAKANGDLFLTLQRFGLVGPIDPSELSREGDDMRDMLRALVDGMQGLELAPEKHPVLM